MSFLIIDSKNVYFQRWLLQFHIIYEPPFYNLTDYLCIDKNDQN